MSVTYTVLKEHLESEEQKLKNMKNHALLEAARKGDIEVLELVLSMDADVNFQDANGYTALCKAASYGHLECVKLLLKNDANSSLKTKSDSMTPLFLATFFKKINVMICLLDSGADINTRDSHGRTPLSFAAQMGYVDVFQCLLDRGASINAHTGGWGLNTSILSLATVYKDTTILRLLLDRDINILHDSSGGGYSVLNYAVSNGSLDAVKLLLEKGVDTPREMTPLINNAVVRGAYDIAIFLLNLSTPSADELRIRILSAVERGDMPWATVLLQNGADVNARNIDGETLLMIASRRKHDTIVVLLVNYGADVHAKDNDGLDALVVCKDKVIRSYLEKYIVKIEETSSAKTGIPSNEERRRLVKEYLGISLD